MAKAQAAAETQFQQQEEVNATVTKAFEKTVRKWNVLTEDVQSVLEKTRRVQQALGIIPSRQKQRLEDAKERYAKGKATLASATEKATAAEKSLQKLLQAQEVVTRQKADADADVHRCKGRSLQVKQLVEKALQMQANETERVRLLYAKQSLRKGKEKRRRSSSRVRHAAGSVGSDNEGLVSVTVSRNLESTVTSLRKDLHGSAKVIEQLHSVAEDAKRQLKLETSQLKSAIAERDQHRDSELNLREQLIKVREEAGEQRSALDRARASASEIEQRHRESESSITASILDLNAQLGAERQAKADVERRLQTQMEDLAAAHDRLSQQEGEKSSLDQKCSSLEQLNIEQEGKINDLHQNMAQTAQQLVQQARELQTFRSELTEARSRLDAESKQHVEDRERYVAELDEMKHSWSQLAETKDETDNIYSQAMRDQKAEFETNLQKLSSTLAVVKNEYEESLAAVTAQHGVQIQKLEDQLLASTEAFVSLAAELDELRNAKLRFLGEELSLANLHEADRTLAEIGYGVQDNNMFNEQKIADLEVRLKQYEGKKEEEGEKTQEQMSSTVDSDDVDEDVDGAIDSDEDVDDAIDSDEDDEDEDNDVDDDNAYHSIQAPKQAIEDFDRINMEIATLLQSEEQLHPIMEEGKGEGEGEVNREGTSQIALPDS